MQGCSQEAKLVLWSLQYSLHLPKARTCTYLCLACQRNKSQYQSNPNLNFTMALLARVPPGVGPNIKERSKQGCSSRCGAGFPASVPRGILPQVRSLWPRAPGSLGLRVLSRPGPHLLARFPALGWETGVCSCPALLQVRARLETGGAQPGFGTLGLAPAPEEAEKRKFLSRVPEQCRSPKDP